MTEMLLVISTFASEEDAARVVRALVGERLVACGSLLPGARSLYRWKGAVESNPECLLIIKSSRGLFDALRDVIEKAHSYEVPEVLALTVIDGAPNYLNWLQSNLRELAQ